MYYQLLWYIFIFIIIEDQYCGVSWFYIWQTAFTANCNSLRSKGNQTYFDTRTKCKAAICDLGQFISTALKWTRSIGLGTQTTSVKNPSFLCPGVCPGLLWSCDSRVYVTQLSIRIRLTVGLSDLLTGTKLKSGCCCSSRSLPPSWELQEELTLSAGDLPSSTLVAVVEEVARWWEWPWGCFTNPDWIGRSRGGEMGSALMFMLWLMVAERPAATVLQTVKRTRRRWCYKSKLSRHAI